MVIEVSFLDGRSNLRDNGYAVDEEAALYELQLQDILQNTRWYLDNLDYLRDYYVSWKNYSYPTPTIPYKFILPHEKHNV
jgi:hypothetical protein